MMSEKLATLGLLRINIFWNKGCDVIIFVHNVIQPDILHQCGKRVKTKSQKVFGADSYICRCYRGKTSRWLFWPPPRIRLKHVEEMCKCVCVCVCVYVCVCACVRNSTRDSFLQKIRLLYRNCSVMVVERGKAKFCTKSFDWKVNPAHFHVEKCTLFCRKQL